MSYEKIWVTMRNKFDAQFVVFGFFFVKESKKTSCADYNFDCTVQQIICFFPYAAVQEV